MGGGVVRVTHDCLGLVPPFLPVLPYLFDPATTSSGGTSPLLSYMPLFGGLWMHCVLLWQVSLRIL